MHGEIYELSLLPEKRRREPVNRVGERHLISNALSLPVGGHLLGDVHSVPSTFVDSAQRTRLSRHSLPPDPLMHLEMALR